MLPLKWEAIRRVIDFWVQVMRMDDGRLVKVVMLEALELGSKVRWVKDLHQSLERCGWRELDVMALNGVTTKEVKQLLKDMMWQRARADWREEVMGKSKLEMTGRLMESECMSQCVWIDCKRHRRMMARLKDGKVAWSEKRR